MSAEEAKENANPLSAFKGLGDSLRWATGLSVNDNGLSCGVRSREDNDNQHLLMAARDGR